MLAELAIANAAFQVIKQTLSNGREIADAGAALGKYFGAEKAIAKQVEAGTGDVLALFQAKETLRKNEEALKYMLNKQRLQGYADFVRFKVEYTRNLREAEKEEARQRYASQKALEENLAIAIKVFGILVVILASLFGVAIYLR
tara:strand:+ start:67 stop:498 length:432 start_codon:yes stop_codon:yes gene_type:complete